MHEAQARHVSEAVRDARSGKICSRGGAGLCLEDRKRGGTESRPLDTWPKDGPKQAKDGPKLAKDGAR